MKNLFAIILLLAVIQITVAGDLDSLRKQLKTISSDSLKAPVYAQIAHEYMQFDTISSRVKKMVYQNESLINSYQALHIYTKYADTTGMRTCFDNLASIYHRLQKYSQAKWFILQSNTLSRIQNDVPNIIASLKKLAAIKTDLKEYKMAEQDLKEASQLASTNNNTPKKVIIKNKNTVVATVVKEKKPGSKIIKTLTASKPDNRIKIGFTSLNTPLAKSNTDDYQAPKKLAGL